MSPQLFAPRPLIRLPLSLLVLSIYLQEAVGSMRRLEADLAKRMARVRALEEEKVALEQQLKELAESEEVCMRGEFRARRVRR